MEIGEWHGAELPTLKGSVGDSGTRSLSFRCPLPPPFQPVLTVFSCPSEETQGNVSIYDQNGGSYWEGIREVIPPNTPFFTD